MIGLAEYCWITTLDYLKIEDVDYEDFITKANQLAEKLRNEFNCSFIIALTHMRIPNDQLLGKNGIGIDIILGGHDHVSSNHD